PQPLPLGRGGGGWKEEVYMEIRGRTKSRKPVYAIYLGNVIKIVQVNLRWVLESYGAEAQVRLLEDVIKHCKDEKERIERIWKLGGMRQ
ncbi:MAG: hypothetical protein ACNA8H_07415, partial [Anaerolineales bacterium]